MTIQTDTAQGTAFVFTRPDVLITCNHVISGAHRISVQPAIGTSSELTHVHSINLACDYAIFAYSNSKVKGLNIAHSSSVKIGDPVYVIGSPKGLEQTLTQGILSGRRIVDGVEYLQLSAAVSHGSSGSPVFDKYGNVIGMVTSTLSDGQSLNFALSIDSLVKFLGVGVPLSLLRANDEVKGANSVSPVTKYLNLDDPEIFRGLDSVYILVENLPKEVEGQGVSVDDITAKIKLRLRSAGIMTHEAKERLKNLGAPMLYTNIFATKFTYNQRDYICYRVLLELSEDGTILRKGTSTNLSVTTWKTETIGMMQLSEFAKIQSTIDEIVDSFLTTWKVSNPRK